MLRCAVSSGLIAELTGSACFDVNRLLDENEHPLFESQPKDKQGIVFIVDRKFTLYRCCSRPIAVLQHGEYFSDELTPKNSCHGDRPLRQAYLVQDIPNGQQQDDLSLSQAKALIATIAEAAGCASADH
jgi:hypothetical protein